MHKIGNKIGHKCQHGNLGTPRTHERALVSIYLIRPIPLEFNFRGIRRSNFLPPWQPWLIDDGQDWTVAKFWVGYSKSISIILICRDIEFTEVNPSGLERRSFRFRLQIFNRKQSLSNELLLWILAIFWSIQTKVVFCMPHTCAFRIA